MPESVSKLFSERAVDKLRVKLMHLIPEASYPDNFEIVRKLPLTTHGKLDTRRLEELYIKSVSTKYDMNIDQLFSELWCKYLGLNIETLDTIQNFTFSELGGTSVAALQLTTEFKDTLKSKCPNEILNLILEKKFDECRTFLINYRKRAIDEDDNEQVTKKVMLENDFTVFWSYNLKACVDSSPLVFKKEYVN